MRPPPPPPPPLPSPPLPPVNNWAPFSSARDFAIMFIVLIIAAIFAAIFFFSFEAFLLRRLWRRKLLHVAPATLFSPATNIAGEYAGCGICLSEFTDGDLVRVLPACGHGFHVTCVDAWLPSRPSCPTCRAAIFSADAADAAAVNPPEP